MLNTLDAAPRRIGKWVFDRPGRVPRGPVVIGPEQETWKACSRNDEIAPQRIPTAGDVMIGRDPVERREGVVIQPGRPGQQSRYRGGAGLVEHLDPIWAD